MQITKKISGHTRSWALFGAAAFCLSASVPAHAQNAWDDLMSDIGIQEKKQEKIDYNERAPLVVPPSLTALPPPEDAVAAGAPNWPTDPDDVQASEEAELERQAARDRRKHEKNPRLSLEEMRKGRRANSEANNYEALGARRDPKLSREEMKLGTKTKEQKEQEQAQQQAFVAEPPRKRLSDPPAGYRTPSPNAPYAEPGKDPKKKPGWFSKLNPFD